MTTEQEQRVPRYKTVRDIDVANKTVLLRVDFNVPFKPGTTEISDTKRIRASLPTIRYLLEQGAKVVICAHLGRPGGKVVEEMRMAPVVRGLSDLLRAPVKLARDCIGPEAHNAVDSLALGEVLVLENLRFHPGEQANDPRFAAELASLADVFVNDAFGTAHRTHASIDAITKFLPSAAGFLMGRELELLGRAIHLPARPFGAILGGAKVSDKIAALANLARRIDVMVIGGGMAATFLKGQGIDVGASPIEEDRMGSAADIIRTTHERGRTLLLPVDLVVAKSFSSDAEHRTVDVSDIPPNWLIMDIGPRTIAQYEEALKSCKTVVWNGPMGVFEWEPFSRGTTRMAEIVTGLGDAMTLVGGGSTAEALDKLGLTEKATQVSTGGGASLEMLTGRVLPGIAALMSAKDTMPSAEAHAVVDMPFLLDIARTTPSKIVLLVVDGLGGIPHPETRKSELETAHIPNLDSLAGRSACGRTDPVMPGITPGSGPGHLSLLGYDPIKYLVGRGVLEALGIDVKLAEGDLAARGNFCTVDKFGTITDRRAGRIPTSESAPLAELLDQIEVPGAELSVYPVKDHRFALVLRGDGLRDNVVDTDPQVIGVQPGEARALFPDSEKSAQAVRAFVAAAAGMLSQQERANMVLLRGFARLPHMPGFGPSYRLKPAAIATFPMYRGIARLVGMKVLPTGQTFDDELDTLEQHYAEHDFFFIHYKAADSAGEDSDFDAKVQQLQELDARIPRLLDMKPDVLVIAGDHSTPSIIGGHSWHAVPVLINSAITRGEGVPGFSERHCATGSIGRMPATNIMLLAMANAGKLAKLGP